MWWGFFLVLFVLLRLSMFFLFFAFVFCSGGFQCTETKSPLYVTFKLRKGTCYPESLYQTKT